MLSCGDSVVIAEPVMCPDIDVVDDALLLPNDADGGGEVLSVPVGGIVDVYDRVAVVEPL